MEHKCTKLRPRALTDPFIFALRLICAWKSEYDVIYNAAQLHSVSVCAGNTHTSVSSQEKNMLQVARHGREMEKNNSPSSLLALI